MELEFKKDFSDVQINWQKFWDGTLDRPILLAICPKENTEPVPNPPFGAAFTQGIEPVVDQTLRWAEKHEFLGDTVPYVRPSLIIDLMPALLGAEIISAAGGDRIDTHAQPFVQDLNSAEIRFQRDSEWWEKWCRLAECITAKCSGKMIPGSAQCWYNNLDTLAAIRGNTQLLMDFYDNPEGIHCCMKQIIQAHREAVEESNQMFAIDQWGSVTGHGFYHTGKTAVPQCDFGFNIGKEHFDEFGLPYLRDEVNMLDDAEYHLDGPGNITHLESIVSIEKIKVIQWVSGAGNENKDWTSLYEQINEFGKGLWLSARSPQQAVELWNRYNKSGRMILHVSAENQAEMDRYLRAFD